MKVSIISDGTPRGTRIADDQGRPIEGVVAARWDIGVGQPAEVRIDLSFIALDAEGVDAVMIGPGGKAVRRIEYADGSVTEFPAST